MNLGQLLNSNAKVRKGYSKDKGAYKNFTETSMGNIISVNTRYEVNPRWGVIHMVMYITAAEGTESGITLFSKASGRSKKLIADEKRIVSTYTTAISFSDYWELDLPLSTFDKGVMSDEEYWSADRNVRGFQEALKSNIENLAVEAVQSQYGDRYSRADILKRFRKGDVDEATAKTRMYGYVRNYGQDVIQNFKETYRKEHSDITEQLDLKLRISNYLNNVAHKWHQKVSTKGLESNTDLQGICTNIVTRDWTYEVNGDMVHIYTKIGLMNRVRVNCTCSQFYYTYAWYNADHQCLIGAKPPAYTKVVGSRLKRISDGTTVRNVDKRPGLCKHLQFFISYLMDEGIIDVGDSRWSRQVYGSHTANKFVKNTFTDSEESGALNNADKIKTAIKDYKEYMKEIGRASRQNKLFGK